MKLQFKAGSGVASAAAAAIGFFGLAGWWFDLPALRTFLPGGPPMAFNSALGVIIAAGAVLLMIAPGRGGRLREVAIHLCAAVLLLLGTLTLTEMALGRDLGIDHLFHPQSGWPEIEGFPGRMAPSTALSLTLIGASIPLLRRRGWAWAGQVLAGAVGLLGLISVLGTIYGVEDLHQFWPMASVSAGTAVATFLLGFALLLATPDRGPMSIVSGRTLTGAMARRILPLVIVVPSLLGFTRIIGHSLGWYGVGVGSALLVAGNVVLFTALALYVLGCLRVVELAGERAQGALRDSEERLRVALEAAGLGTWTFLCDDGTIEFDERAQELYGVGPGPMTHDDALVRTVLHPDDVGPMMDAAAAALDPAGEGRFQSIYRVTRPGGGYRRVRAWGAVQFEDLPGAGRRPVRVIGASRDVTAELEAQAAVRRSEARLRAVLEALPVPVFISDAAGRIETVNPAAEVMWGGPPPRSERPEDYAQHYRAWWPDSGRPVESHQWGLARALATGEIVTAEELEVETLDGQRRRILNYALPVRGAGGEIVGGVAVNVDISARVQAEDALRQSEDRYRTFIENSTEGIWRFELDVPMPASLPEHEQVRYLYEHAFLAECNVAMARQYGYDRPEEIIGRSAGDLLIQSDPRNTDFLLAFVRSGFRLNDAESHELDAGGAERVFLNNLVGIADDRGRLLRAWGSQRDITDRKLAQESLRRERAFLRQVIAATPSMVFVKDWNGRFVLVNEAIAAAYGTTVEDLVGKGDADFSPDPEEVAAFLRDDREVMLTRRQKFIPEEPVTTTGGRRWFATIKVPLVDADGSCSRVLGVATDITERKVAEEALRRNNERLEDAIRTRTRELEDSYIKLRLSERMAFVGTLSAGIGHDIGNLLLPIRERLESLAVDASLPESTRADLATTRSGLNYLTRLTSALRTLASDPDEDHGPADVTDVASWWHEAEPLLHGVLPRGVALEWTPPPPGLALRIGAAALTQIVFNLVQNAGDALSDRPGGRAPLAAEPAEDGWARLTVADNGPGMTAYVRERCMEPFFTTKTRRVSTGMGLSLVHGLVHRAGGHIDLDSAPGRGTTFRLTIPAAVASPDGGAPRPLAVVSIGDRRTAGFVGAMLASMGFEVEEAQRPNGTPACLWVLGAGPDGLTEPEREAVLDFVQSGARTRALVLGGEPLPDESGRVHHLPAGLDPLAIRRALQGAAGGLAAIRPEVLHGADADQRDVR